MNPRSVVATGGALVLDAECNLGSDDDQGLGGERDDARAFKLYEQACAADESQGCLNAGLCLRDAKGTVADTGAAISRLEKACDGGQSEACHHLGLLLVVEDRVRAVASLRKSCDQGRQDSCRELKRLEKRGQ